MTPEEAEGFYEEDEDPREVLAAFGRGAHGVTARPVAGWKCPHLTMTGAGLLSGPVISSCGCEMEPIYADEENR